MSHPVIVQFAPRFTAAQALGILRALYGREGTLEALPSERDQNFKVVTPDEAVFVLKIANGTGRAEILDFENRAIAHLAAAARNLAVPRLVPTLDGREMGQVREDGSTHFVRLLTWIPGVPLALVKPHSEALLVSLGRALAEMDRALEGFEHPAMHRPFPWDLTRTLETVADAPADPVNRSQPSEDSTAHPVNRSQQPFRAALLHRLLSRFRDSVLPALPSLRTQVIHGDWNDYNVLVSPAPSADRRVVGAIDFGDMVSGPLVADLAVAAAYAMLDKPDPVGAAAAIVRGYHQVNALTEGELAVLFDLIRARLAVSVAMAARQGEAAPGNEYLQISQQQVWRLIEKLDTVPPAWAQYVLRHACGLEPCPAAPAVRAWLESNRDAFHPVVLPAPRAGNAVRVDLSVGSPDLRRFDTAMSPAAFTAHVGALLADSGAQIGVGSYGEARLVYVTELFQHAHNWTEENRTVHLGIDLFGAEDTPVCAPLPGIVHSLQVNDASGDYGPTIVLQHDVGEGVRFYTLYGHLCARCLNKLHEGDRVEAGDTIGCFGGVEENGGWAPHLHFQVIADLLDRHGDFPGVAAPSERPIWFSLCPDPNLILGIPPDLLAPAPPEPQAILEARRQRLGPNLSVSYRKPLTILRGHRQYLIDADGRRFLDAVNNVPHVGHSHPRVVEAAARQLAVLTTNTRYLHPLLTAYLERLAALLPPPLEVCFIVNSGSEANELALRLARAATGQRGVVVVGGAYHGNTTSLIDISPYKFDGPGGGGCPPHVRAAQMPDRYRHSVGSGFSRIHSGAPVESGFSPGDQPDHRVGRGFSPGDQPDHRVGRGFSPGDAARELAASPYGLSAFFCESLLSCGGQIVLPDGYLAAAYEAVREAGGICVADEVQVGFGRVGTHFWGFETQGVVPDVVTMGKPIGNGFPLAAVATTREIARSFDTGMEYFNTFGGSPVACAVGLAVLDVMRDEGLQQHALDVGTCLHALLSDLRRFPIVGDVRGLGLFLGVELVRDRTTLEPAAAQADYIVNRMRDRGILLSTDGPLHNVIKIKPPMPFDRKDAERLAATLAEILEEDAAQP